MSRPRLGSWGVLLALALAAGGCTTKYEVESNTQWRGWVEDHDVADQGCAVYEARQGGTASFTKQTDEGYLRARVTGFWGDERWVETTAPHGTVIVVANN